MKLVRFLLLLLLVPVVAGQQVDIFIEEGGKIVSFYGQYYVYQLNGTIDVVNPTPYSLFNIDIPFYIGTLDVRANYSTTENYISNAKLYIFALEPNSSISFEYDIVGITTEDLSTNNESILANGILQLQPKIYSNIFGTLKKGPLENATITGRNARLISAEFRNPTAFNYTLDKIQVIKTTQNNPNAEIASWDFTGDKTTLEAFAGWDFDFIDENAYEGEIYWLNSDIYIDAIDVNSTSNISRFDEEDVFIIVPNATLNETIPEEDIAFLSSRIYLRKSVSQTLVVPGDIVNVTVIVNNFQPDSIEATVTDPIISGFEVVSIEEGEVGEDEISWDVKIPPGTLKRLRYQIKYIDEDSLGLDYFRPAVLHYNGEVYTSQSIPFVRKYVPEDRVFVQKKVKFLAGEEVQVTISVQNLGEADLNNIILKEHLLSSAEFREITKAPEERGVWRIENLSQNEIWETGYITDRAHVTNTLPDIIGVNQGSVLQTIILSNLITTSFSVLPTNIVEIVSVAALGLIILLYFLPTSVFSRKRKRQSHDLRTISYELDTLRSRTQHQPGSLHTQQPVQQQQNVVYKNQSLQDPRRTARHEALQQTADMLQKSRTDIGGDEKPGEEKPPEKKD